MDYVCRVDTKGSWLVRKFRFTDVNAQVCVASVSFEFLISNHPLVRQKVNNMMLNRLCRAFQSSVATGATTQKDCVELAWFDCMFYQVLIDPLS